MAARRAAGRAAPAGRVARLHDHDVRPGRTWSVAAGRRYVPARRGRPRPGRLAGPGTRRRVRAVDRTAGEAAGPGPAATGTPAPRPGLRRAAPRARPRQDR